MNCLRSHCVKSHFSMFDWTFDSFINPSLDSLIITKLVRCNWVMTRFCHECCKQDLFLLSHSWSHHWCFILCFKLVTTINRHSIWCASWKNNLLCESASSSLFHWCGALCQMMLCPAISLPFLANNSQFQLCRSLCCTDKKYTMLRHFIPTTIVHCSTFWDVPAFALFMKDVRCACLAKSMANFCRWWKVILIWNCFKRGTQGERLSALHCKRAKLGWLF